MPVIRRLSDKFVVLTGKRSVWLDRLTGVLCYNTKTQMRAKRAKYEGGLLIYGCNAMAKFHLNWFVVILAACVSSRLTTNTTRKMWTIQPHSCSSDFQIDLKCFPKNHLQWFKLNNMAVYAGINKGSVPQMHVVIGRIGFYDQFYSKFSGT